MNAERLPARAGDVAGGLEDRERAADEGIEPGDPSLSVERERKTAKRRAEAQDGGIEPGPAHRPRADELVVAAEHELAASQVRRGEQRRKSFRDSGRIRNLALG